MVNRIRDPIHGYIKPNLEEIKILDSKPVQRLRKVKQMSTSSLVYPSATHTRFSHSIGVMHIAGMFADSLGLSENKRRELRISGLIHDIGHGPFSHTSDRVSSRYGFTHEKHSCEILRNQLYEKIPDDISISSIEDNILSQSDLKVIAGDIDADRIDYLNRDAINTGLDHGSIDFETIIEFADVKDDRLVFDRKATYAITELLAARLYMHNAIINHHVSRQAETILERALDLYVQKNSVKKMMRHNDYTMHTELINSGEKITKLYNRVIERDLLKKCYTIRGNSIDRNIMNKLSKLKAKKCEKQIADIIGIERTDVIVVTPMLSESESLNVPIIDDNKNIRQLKEISNLAQKLPKEKSNQSRFHVYSKKEYEPEVEVATNQVLNERINLDKSDL